MSTQTTQDSQPARAKTKWKKIMVGCVTILALAVAAGFIAVSKVNDYVRHMKSRANLECLYDCMYSYAQAYESWPSVQPTNTPRTAFGGVRNLFPFYKGEVSGRALLTLFQPPGLECQAFSDNPTIDEFDRHHIGYCYNAAATYNGNAHEVLMCEQGVSNGVLLLNAKDPADRPVFRNGAHVLFNNGTVIWVPADRHGRLATDVVSAAEWDLMVK